MLTVESASVTASFEPAVASGRSSKRYPRLSPLARQASSLPHGFHVPWPGRRISQAPGFERLTRSVPGDGTKGVTIEAVATGEPERSWIVTDHPFLSFMDFSFLDLNELKQLVEVLVSEFDDLLSIDRNLISR